jgi:hypothetical protein
MSTGGLVAPEIDQPEMIATAIFSIVGVCAYALAIGAVVDRVLVYVTPFLGCFIGN